MKKRAQQTMSLPFGMIFSIILIVIFIVVAFIAVKSFLDLGKTSSIGLFYKELQDVVDDAWQSQSSQKNFKVDLPGGVKKICFANLSQKARGSKEVLEEYKEIEFLDPMANTFLIPLEAAQGLEYKNIKHLNIEKITKDKNPYCIGSENDLLIKKDFYDKFVTIE